MMCMVGRGAIFLLPAVRTTTTTTTTTTHTQEDHPLDLLYSYTRFISYRTRYNLPENSYHGFIMALYFTDCTVFRSLFLP
jgi:hypothetical protein